MGFLIVTNICTNANKLSLLCLKIIDTEKYNPCIIWRNIKTVHRLFLII